jgi:hypothetical protein
MCKLEQCPEYSGSNNSCYYYALNVLINIAVLKFDKAALIVESIIRDKRDYSRWYLIYILKFYLQVHKLINFNTGDENACIEFMITYTSHIFEDIEKQYKRLLFLIFSNLASIDGEEFIALNYADNDNTIRYLIKFSDFEPFFVQNIQDENLKISKKKFHYERKNLDNLKLEILKNLFHINDILVQNGFDKLGKLNSLLKNLFENCGLNDPNEDQNYLLNVPKILILESYTKRN